MDKKAFDGEYEMRLFSSLPKELKEKVINFNGQGISIMDIEPLSLVCVQISSNPGVKPFLVEQGKTTFDLFKILAKERGFSIEKFHNALQSKCNTLN